MENKQLAELALQFLSRVDLKGNEVPAFNQLVAGLQELAQTSNGVSAVEDKQDEAA